MPNSEQLVEQFYDKSKALRPEKQEQTNAFDEFLHSAAYSGIQAPIAGVSQLVNKTLIYAVPFNVIPEVNLVSAPKPAEFGSVNWHAQTVGGAVGMLAPFMLVNKGVGSVMGREVAAAEAMSLRFKVTQAATAGFVYDGLMRPVQEGEGNFWGARFKHATIGAVTFGTLAGTAHGLDVLGKAAPELGPMRRPLNNELFNHTVAGIVAGGTNAQLESLLSGHGPASMQDTMRGGYTFAVVGLGLKGVEKTSEGVTAKYREIIQNRELRTDLREVPTRAADGKVVDVYEKISTQPESVLRAEQKERIFKVLGETHRRYLDLDNSLHLTHKNKGYQIVNWKHTRGEIDQVLEASKLDKSMKPEQIEDAILASIFSDSVKTPENFIRHHLDGAKLAQETLPKYFDMTKPENVERINGIVQAAREHQIGPPGFMGFMAQMFIRNSIKGELNGAYKKVFGESAKPDADPVMKNVLDTVDGKRPASELSQSELQLIDKLGVDRWKIEQIDEVKAIQGKIAKPFESVRADNKGIVDFSEAQHRYLDIIKIDDWYVPNEATPWYRSSRRVIDGDSLINYASPDGWAKIAQIRGPNTIFQDATIWDSLASAKGSYHDAYSIITADVRPLAQAGLARTEAAVERVTPAMQKWIDANKEGFGYAADEKVSFWDRDAAPLKYPEPGIPLEAQDALRLDFATLIRNRMVAELRAQQGNYSDKP